MVNSRQKGASYERHVAGLFKAEGYDARRGQQFCGINGDADVIGIPGIHIECKAVESPGSLPSRAPSPASASACA